MSHKRRQPGYFFRYITSYCKCGLMLRSVAPKLARRTSSERASLLVLWRKPLNVETADYLQIPWVWPRGILPKTQKLSKAPRAGHAFATNPLLSPWVARGLPGGRPLGMAADTRIRVLASRTPGPEFDSTVDH